MHLRPHVCLELLAPPGIHVLAGLSVGGSEIALLQTAKTPTPLNDPASA